MGLTPVRHVRVADPLWDAAKAKAAAEFRTVADVINDCLRAYVGLIAPKPPADLSVPVIPDLTEAEVDGFLEAVSEGRSPAVGTGGNGKAGAVPTSGGRKRKAREKAAPNLAAALAESLAAPPYGCCKHCKRYCRGGHSDPCLNGCHDSPREAGG